jgi:hypothetical protein
MILRDMAGSVLRDDESLRDILIAGDSKVPGYKIAASEALDNLFFFRPAFVNATLGSEGRHGGCSTDSGRTPGERGPTRPLTRMVIQVL